jgi:hypothetical protein
MGLACAACAGGRVRRQSAGQKGKSSFLKKRSKKLLIVWLEAAPIAAPKSKSFLVLFF